MSDTYAVLVAERANGRRRVGKVHIRRNGRTLCQTEGMRRAGEFKLTRIAKAKVSSGRLCSNCRILAKEAGDGE